ncbi:MAG: aminotransferase class III-fold pyridoxal phosphate-dependent enzyme [Oligoflexia bacterium]|nr:aminotransferase class III-fold pyridoxal phosphate-dependent enzyme [Oligoflexia bacterium]
MVSRYQKSEAFLERALKTIPLGSQTFSKSKTQFPLGVSPYFIKKAKGSHVWDLDGNEYIDFISALASITLGYSDPDVDAAVKAQLEDGVIFSLPHPIEAQVAEQITEMVPCAEMVRFGKNGSDATAGAVRLARAATGRDHVLVCGYHGWQDWYIGVTARNRGVPAATRALTHIFNYNDISSLEKYFKEFKDQVAAVIMEPANVTMPLKGFLEEVKSLTHKNGAVLIFDETITGFRYANGGAQEYFGVTPDLATFGKGLANGYPVSAIAGRRDLMKLMEEIFFSFTFGGETLSLAAASCTLNKLKTKPILTDIAKTGAEILKTTEALIKKHQCEEFLSVSGHPAWSFLVFKDAPDVSLWHLKTLFMQEMFSRGILTFGGHNLNHAHSTQDTQKLSQAYDEVFSMLSLAVKSKDVKKMLRCQPLEPLFKVR